jgi:dephospho-CoA kinase
MIIIGLSGKMGSGKNYIAEKIKNHKSENKLDFYKFDYIIDNSESNINFEKEINQLLNEINKKIE